MMVLLCMFVYYYITNLDIWGKTIFKSPGSMKIRPEQTFAIAIPQCNLGERIVAEYIGLISTFLDLILLGPRYFVPYKGKYMIMVIMSYGNSSYTPKMPFCTLWVYHILLSDKFALSTAKLQSATI